VSDPIKSIRFAKGMSQSLCVALMLLTCGALSAQGPLWVTGQIVSGGQQ